MARRARVGCMKNRGSPPPINAPADLRSCFARERALQLGCPRRLEWTTGRSPSRPGASCPLRQAIAVARAESANALARRPTQERRSLQPTRSLARERGRCVVSRLAPPHRAFHRAGLAGHLRGGDGRRMSICGWGARKGFRYRDSCRWKVTSVGQDPCSWGWARSPRSRAARGSGSRRCSSAM
jgi:hypothetical protein